MQFSTKDLMVSVVPEAAADAAKFCALHTHVCFYPTFCHHHFSPVFCHYYSPCHLSLCRHYITHCHFHTITACQQPISFCQLHISGCGIAHSCPAGSTIVACHAITQPFEFENPLVIRTMDELGALREELKATMARLDEVAEAGLPGEVSRVEDLKELEAKLKDAVKEVQKEIKERR